MLCCQKRPKLTLPELRNNALKIFALLCQGRAQLVAGEIEPVLYAPDSISDGLINIWPAFA